MLFFAYHRVYEQTFSRSTYTGDAEKSAAAADTERQELAAVVRDIFVNPFHPLPAIDRVVLAWNSGAVVQLARDIYEGRSFDRLTELGRMLEQAGCRDRDVVGHCHEEGQVHVRGCWLIDFLLGKE